MENETEKIVHFVCASEQVSYLENSNAFFPRLDAIANALQSAADCSVDDKIDFDDFISIAAMVDAEIFVLNDNEFPPYVRGILIDTAETSLKFKCRYIILVRKGAG